MITPQLLHTWAQGLCKLPNAGRADAAAMLALPGPIVQHTKFARVEPPPAGVVHLDIYDDPETHTKLRYIQIVLESPGLSLSALEAELGKSKTAVRFHPDSTYDQWFAITVAGAPCTCDVYATFPTEPAASSTATRLMLRYGPSPAP